MANITAGILTVFATAGSMYIATLPNHPVEKTQITPPLAPITTPAIMTITPPKYTPPPMDHDLPKPDEVIHDIIV